MARMASSRAERISPSDRPIEKSASRSFQASSAAPITITAAGGSVWPCPHRMPDMAVTIMAAEVVSSVPWLARSEDRLSSTASKPVSASAASA